MIGFSLLPRATAWAWALWGKLDTNVVCLLYADRGSDWLSDRTYSGGPMGQDYAGRAGRRSLAIIRAPYRSGFNCHIGGNGACNPVCRRSLARLAVVGGMDCCCGERGHDGAELDHAIASRAQNLGAGHNDHFRSGRRRSLDVIARGPGWVRPDLGASSLDAQAHMRHCDPIWHRTPSWAPRHHLPKTKPRHRHTAAFEQRRPIPTYDARLGNQLFDPRLVKPPYRASRRLPLSPTERPM